MTSQEWQRLLTLLPQNWPSFIEPISWIGVRLHTLPHTRLVAFSLLQNMSAKSRWQHRRSSIVESHWQSGPGSPVHFQGLLTRAEKKVFISAPPSTNSIGKLAPLLWDASGSEWKMMTLKNTGLSSWLLFLLFLEYVECLWHWTSLEKAHLNFAWQAGRILTSRAMWTRINFTGTSRSCCSTFHVPLSVLSESETILMSPLMVEAGQGQSSSQVSCESSLKSQDWAVVPWKSVQGQSLCHYLPF